MLRQTLSSSRQPLLSLGAIFTIWASSNGINAVIHGINKAYNERETRPFWNVRGMAVILDPGGRRGSALVLPAEDRPDGVTGVGVTGAVVGPDPGPEASRWQTAQGRRSARPCDVDATPMGTVAR